MRLHFQIFKSPKIQHGFRSLLFSAILCLSISANYPQDYFRWPIDGEPRISGSFCELRPEHFHMGIDIKTGGREGLPIYAVADGFLSRIDMSGSGYGHVLFLTHPNGYTTLYAHCSAFADTITSYLHSIQYATESFQQQLFLGKDRIKFRKGEVIGWTGNTGSSQAPHLHFEIRETKTGMVVNPQLFGFGIRDSCAPQIRSFKIYPLDENGYVEAYTNRGKLKANKGSSVTLAATNNDGVYYPVGARKIIGNGRLGFAINNDDWQAMGYDRIGVYSIEIKANDKVIYLQENDRLAFDDRRMIDQHIDYADKVNSRRQYEKSFHCENGICILKGADGTMKPTLKETRIEYTLKDIAGHKATLKFNINAGEDSVMNRKETDEITFYQNKDNQFTLGDFELNIPKESLFDNISVKPEILTSTSKNVFSKVLSVTNREAAPFRSFASVSIKSELLPEELKSKACIVSVTKNNSFLFQSQATYNGHVYKGKIKSLGNYGLAIDTTPPVAQAINIHNGANMSGRHDIVFNIGDNLSGVEKFRGEIDGKWVLFQSDAKSNKVRYVFDEHCSRGKHNLKFTATDLMGNTKTILLEFYR